MGERLVRSGSGTQVLSNRAWSTGERMIPTRSDGSANVALARNWVWECTTAGTSNGTPTWSASVTEDSTTVTQNGVVWTARRPGFSSGSTYAWSFATIYVDYVTGLGDDVLVASDHSESVAGASTVVYAGNHYCVDHTAGAPFPSATGAAIARTGSGGSFNTNGDIVLDGISVSMNGAAGPNIHAANNNSHARLRNCTLTNTSSTASHTIGLSSAGSGSGKLGIELDGCTLNISGISSKVITLNNHVVMRGGAINATHASQAAIFGTSNSNQRITSLTLENVDLSGTTAAASLISNAGTIKLTGANIKLPASWTGTTLTSAGPGDLVTLTNIDNGDTNYRDLRQTQCGTVYTETTIIRTGGAAVDSVGVSWRMVSTSSALYPLRALSGMPIIRPFPGTAAEDAAWSPGTSVTVDVETVTDGVTLEDDEFSIDVEYLGTNGQPLGVVARTEKTNVLSAGTALTTSSETWTTTGLTTPVKQYCRATITPREKGVLVITPKLYKASTTVYVCKQPTVT